MERAPDKPAARSQAETFGIEPSVYDRDIPEVIRSLGDALHRFEREAGEDDDIREEFAGVYPPAKIEADLAEVHRLERAYDKEDDLETKKNRLYAMVMELIVQDMAHEWFPDCVVWRASRFDDYKRQTDLFMDIPDPEGGWLTIALDVTVSREAAAKKMSNVLDELDRGRFHDVDYFASDIDPGRSKGRAFMPRFIVGASRGGVASLARLYGQWRRHGPNVGSRTKEQDLDKLRFHQVGDELYHELIGQADYGHGSMRELLKETPTYQETKRTALKSQASYLGKVHKELKRRLKELERQTVAYQKANGPVPANEVPPPNGVLEAIQQRAA